MGHINAMMTPCVGCGLSRIPLLDQESVANTNVCKDWSHRGCSTMLRLEGRLLTASRARSLNWLLSIVVRICYAVPTSSSLCAASPFALFLIIMTSIRFEGLLKAVCNFWECLLATAIQI
ncbi:hypothetical protein C8J56DRAFT_1026504 [Mycena floridula]|nr:hypothetical protein C8J56DRAFT_1026504 [Mycena floridula]